MLLTAAACGERLVSISKGRNAGLTLALTRDLQARHAQLLKQAAARHFAASRWEDFVVVGELLAAKHSTAKAFSRLAHVYMQLQDMDRAVSALALTL